MKTLPNTQVVGAETAAIVNRPIAVPITGTNFTRLTHAVVAVVAGIIAPAMLARIDFPRFSENGTP